MDGMPIFRAYSSQTSLSVVEHAYYLLFKLSLDKAGTFLDPSSPVKIIFWVDFFHTHKLV